MTTINMQLHNSATHAKGHDPACPVCNPPDWQGDICEICFGAIVSRNGHWIHLPYLSGDHAPILREIRR